jgi:molybdopterin/thiamine biosynthesis adenylyltransferase
MSKQKKAEKVQEEIAKLNNEGSNKQIAFNPQTGELEVVDNSKETTPNSTVITEVAKEGFASHKPIVYLFEDDIADFFLSGKEFEENIALEWDNENVYHIHDLNSKIPLSGKQCISFFVKSSEIDFTNYNELLKKTLMSHSHLYAINSNANQRINFDDNNLNILDILAPNIKILITAFLITGKDVKKKTFVCADKNYFECDSFYVPQKFDLYSRSKGLIETDILKNKKIAVVGLGSFGSNVAVELAKSGIGNFVLFDFDRIELSNISRHICGLNDLGRFKTLAIKDSILLKNPNAIVDTNEININEHFDLFTNKVQDCDLILCLTDENKSRELINDYAIANNKKIIYGRAITRAEGGDIFRYTPNGTCPCLGCLIGNGLYSYKDDEITTKRQLERNIPAYMTIEDKESTIQVGLSSDIIPICNMIVKLSLVELSKGLPSGITSLEEDLIADYYIWANRREKKYKNLEKMNFRANQLTILRWYGVRVTKDLNCLSCNNI